MLTEVAARWVTFVAFFFRDPGLLEVRTDNRLNTEYWLGGEVVRMVPKQQWTEYTITS